MAYRKACRVAAHKCIEALPLITISLFIFSDARWHVA